MNRRRHILLAEDDENDVALTTLALRRGGLRHEIVVVRDGVEVMEHFGIHPHGGKGEAMAGEMPGVLLLDLRMPRLDGLEVLERLRAQPRTRNLPVVMLTSSRQEQDLLRSYDLRVNAFVVKPVEYDDFLRAVGETGLFWCTVNEPPPEPGR
ncbi:response regulator [Roseomonas sp. GC11]|uniref:response regulator n=1 Tax=Roseomonas sp. GC11 TaxID=2950546 RepID=UPI00210B9FDB|nr:response regulator [Roseomonas sp. GC11]MCQ4162148.1 response regulator [Roseomonas sp. GC11]